MWCVCKVPLHTLTQAEEMCKRKWSAAGTTCYTILAEAPLTSSQGSMQTHKHTYVAGAYREELEVFPSSKT